MSRQLEFEVERRESKKRDALVKALEFGFVGALEAQGVTLLGLAFKFDGYDCLMTVKADVGGVRQVAFVGSDTIINCILKAEGAALNQGLRWRVDRFHQK